MDKLHESLFIMYKCSNTINKLYAAFKEHLNNPNNKILSNISVQVMFYIMMETVSLLKEYDDYFIEKKIEHKYKERVKDTKAILRPVINKIRKWNDLSYFRNCIIAHPWRDQKASYKFTIPHQAFFSVPRNYFEIAHLCLLISYFYQIIYSEFKDELNESIKYAEALQPKSEVRMDYSNLNSELLIMADEVNKKSKELGKSLFLKVILFEFPDDDNIEKEAG